jgi:hypothetical protein
LSCMEGGLLLHAAWLLSFTFVWVYRRYFETVAPRDAAFEALCAKRPLLAALHVEKGAEERVLAELARCLPRVELIATGGGWPWVHYVLRVGMTTGRGRVRVHVERCRVLRSKEARPPALTTALAAVTRRVEGAVTETWLHPGAHFDVRGRASGARGWRFRAAEGGRANVEEWHELAAMCGAGLA